VPAEAEKAAWRTRLLVARTALTAAERATAAHQLTAHLLRRLSGIARIAAYVPVGDEPGSLDLLDVLRERGTVVLLPVVRPNFDLDWGVYRGREGLTAGRWGLREPAPAEGDRSGPARDRPDPGPRDRRTDHIGSPDGPVDDRGDPRGRRGLLADDRGTSSGGPAPSVGDRSGSAGGRAGPVALDGVGAILVPALAADHRGTRLGRGRGYYDRALATVDVSVPVVALLHDGELVPYLPVDPWDRPVTAAVTPTDGWTNLPLVPHHRG